MQFLEMPSVEDLMRGLCGWLCQFVYWIVAWLYELFMNISRVEILTSDNIKPIYDRITMILTIVMVFYVTFEAVKYVIQPEVFSDKEKGANRLVMKMVLVVVLIAFVPSIFSWAYKFQNAIFDNQLFSKVILGKQDVNTQKFGRVFSANILGMFYYLDEETWTEDELDSDRNCEDLSCKMVVTMNTNSLIEYGEIPLMNKGLTSKAKNAEDIETYYIHFDGLFAVGVGIFIAYMLVLYCVDAGVRVAQLAFLQIIAPIPIIAYLSPKKDGMFEKWMKQCFTTYLDLFFRVGIIYFILLICQILSDAYSSGTLLNNIPGEASQTMKVFIYIALVLGLLMFAKKAPQMLSELFPKSGAASGNFGLKPGERFAPIKAMSKPAGRVVGAATGAVTGAAAGLATGIGQGWRRRNSLNKNGEKKGIGAGIGGALWGAARGAVGGAGRGLVQGGKKGNVLKNSFAGAKDQIQSNRRFGNRQENGYGLGDQIGDRARDLVGARSRVEAEESKKAPIARHDDALKKVFDTRSQIEKRALDKITESGKGGAAARDYAQKQNRLKALQEDQTVIAKEFKVAKFTDAKTAQDAYDADVALAKASVNKSNFIDPNTGTFDKAGYDAAVKAAASKVNASDYSVAYKTEEEARAAYDAAVKAKRASVDRTQFADDAQYRAAVAAAEASVSAGIYAKGYASKEEADAALGAEIQRQIKAVDEAKDAAVEEYVSTVPDGAIDAMLETLSAEVTEYNQTAEASRTIAYTDNLAENGAIDTTKIKSNFTKFSDFVKKEPNGIKSTQDRNATELVGINAQIDRIKRQQEGSTDKK